MTKVEFEIFLRTAERFAKKLLEVDQYDFEFFAGQITGIYGYLDEIGLKAYVDCANRRVDVRQIRAEKEQCEKVAAEAVQEYNSKYQTKTGGEYYDK